MTQRDDDVQELSLRQENEEDTEAAEISCTTAMWKTKYRVIAHVC